MVIGLEKEKPGTYRIYDYFSKPIKLWYKDDTGEYRTSKYDFLEIDDFFKVRNIDYGEYSHSAKPYAASKISFLLLPLLS